LGSGDWVGLVVTQEENVSQTSAALKKGVRE